MLKLFANEKGLLTMKNKKNIGELIAYIIAGIFAFGGLGLFTCGVIGYYLSENNIFETGKWLGLGFKSWGYIALAIGLIIGIITLLVNAKKIDIEEERRAKRAQRLGE